MPCRGKRKKRRRYRKRGSIHPAAGLQEIRGTHRHSGRGCRHGDACHHDPFEPRQRAGASAADRRELDGEASGRGHRPPLEENRFYVAMHNVTEEKIFRPAVWNSFGMDKEGQDYRACGRPAEIFCDHRFRPSHVFALSVHPEVSRKGMFIQWFEATRVAFRYCLGDLSLYFRKVLIK